MSHPTAFLEHSRREIRKRPVEERRRDFREIYAPRPPGEVAVQGERCMDCGIPFCQGTTGCPLGNLIPEWNELVFNGQWEEAIHRLHATNNFPEITGRVCPAPCEQACTLNIQEEPVSIKLVEGALGDRALDRGLVPRPASAPTGKRVAVVGSGPSGLAAAQQLARAGHRVVVFERQDRIGGLLRYGIPDFKLDKGVLDRRIAQLEAEGVEMLTGRHVGVDPPAGELVREFDAVVLACGCEKPRELDVPGRELAGVHLAMEFLAQQNRRVAGDGIPPEEEILARGKRVVVIGGGDTGSDCIGTSLRQGAARVVNVELLPEPPAKRAPAPPWPWWPEKMMPSHAHEEGGERVFSVLTKRFLDDGQGRVAGLEAGRVRFEADPEGGRPRMVEVPDSLFRIEADLVLLAMGYVHPVHEGLVEELGLALTARGDVATDREWRTSVGGVFSTGDMTRGQSLVVSAIADGRRAARAVDVFLMGGSDLPVGPVRDLGDMLEGAMGREEL